MQGTGVPEKTVCVHVQRAGNIALGSQGAESSLGSVEAREGRPYLEVWHGDTEKKSTVDKNRKAAVRGASSSRRGYCFPNLTCP